MWNHRVWRTVYGADANVEEAFEIKETYYNSAGEVCACTEGPTEARGYSLEELNETLQRMLKLVESTQESDILNTGGFVFSKWDFDNENN